MSHHNEKDGEIQVLAHEAWPHYRKAFVVIFGLFLLYLAVIFAMGGDGSLGGH